MKKSILHIAPLDRNIGDNALNLAIRAMLGDCFDIRHMELVGNPFGQREFEIMQSCDAIIFGGGGVLHSCSGGSSRKNRTRTGTMWNMDLKYIKALRTKIILYSAGFNRFDGEPPPLEQMGEFLDVLDRKGALVSLRNDLSKGRLLNYFPRFGGIDVTPDPGMFCRGSLRAVDEPYALLQIACDRLEFRYPTGVDRFIDLLNELKKISPVPFYLIPHTNADRNTYLKLRDTLNVDLIIEPGLSYEQASDAMDLYRNAEFTISTRGHSQICSLGNGTPSFAMSTHPKARGFMVDMGQEDAVFDYLNGDREECAAAFTAFLSRLPEIRSKLVAQNAICNARIADFNRRLYDFIDGTYVPPSFVNDYISPPKITPARLEDELATYSKLIKPPVKTPTDTKIAYLPLRREKKGPGTYYLEPGQQPLHVLFPSVNRDSRKRKSGPPKPGSRGVVISCDANYFPAVPTCIAALRRYNPRLPVTFLDVGLSPDQVPAAKKLADDYLRVDELLDSDVRTFPSHLTKAALSSLFGHYSNYEKVLYLDVDALVLGNLNPMFDALDADCDLVGVRGGFFRWMSEGYSHQVGSEIEPEFISALTSFFPTANLDAPGINTGCFVVWSHVSRQWMGLARRLFAFLPHFKTADQALINLMITTMGLRLKLFSPMYNCMGFQLSDKRHDVQRLLTTIEVDAESCQLFMGDRKIVVAHFAGRAKPWNTSIDDPASLAWDWHAASSLKERRRMVTVAEIRKNRSHAAIMKIFDNEGITPKTDYEFYLTCTAHVREMGLTRTAHELYERALRTRPTSRAAARGICLTAGKVGDLVRSVRFMADTKYLQESKDKKISLFREVDANALNGRRSKLNAINGKINRTVRLRSAAAIGKTSIIQSEVKKLGSGELRTPENILYARIAAGWPTESATASVIQTYMKSPSTLRRAENAARRVAQGRTDAILRIVHETISEKSIVQYGVGTGAFIWALSLAGNAKPIALDNGLEKFGLYPQMQVSNVSALGADQTPVAMVIAAHIYDRVSSPGTAIKVLASGLESNGYLLVVDAVNTRASEDCLEGLSLLPPVRKLPKVHDLRCLLAGVGLELVGSWYVSGERLLLFERKTINDVVPTVAGRGVKTLEGARKKIAKARARARSGNLVNAKERQECEHLKASPTEILGARLARRKGLEPLQDPPVLSVSGKNVRSKKMIMVEPARHRDPAQGIHFAYFSSINAGDRALIRETGLLLEQCVPEVAFSQVNLDDPVDEIVIGRMNSCQSVVVGGGGIFHSTARDGAISQWNMAAGMLAKLRTPLIFLGVGLNEFGDEQFYRSDFFRSEMAQILEKTAFFGLRERETVQMLREIYPHHADRVHYQPCPTIDMAARRSAIMHPRRKKSGAMHVALNFAFDRPAQRFAARSQDALKTAQKIVQGLLDRRHRVSVICHCPEDRLGHTLLPTKLQDHTALIDLSGGQPQEIYSTYLGVDLTIGMRTHSQLVPIGLGMPAITISTHEKLSRVARDLDLPSWSVKLFDTECAAKILGRADTILADPAGTSLELIRRQVESAQITQNNIGIIREIVMAGHQVGR